MIRLIIFLANLEAKLKDKGYVEKEFDEVKKTREKTAKYAPSPTTTGKIKAGIKNIGKITQNAYDNTIGYFSAKTQNFSTKRHYKKTPEAEDKIVYMMHGAFQNEGSQWKMGKQLKKEGYMPYHLKGHHKLPRKENAEKAFEQIKDFQEDTELKEPSKRKDMYSGHSSGADVGIYMAGDERIKKYGIKHVQARAPAPSGIEAKTLGQKLLAPLIKEENLKGYMGRRNAVEIEKRKPKVDVHVVSGKYDNLVPPSDAAYKHAKKHYVINDADSTHFGTAGGNKKMNEVQIDILKKHDKDYKKAA